MPIDSGQGDWLYVAVLAAFAFVANAVANLLSFERRWLAAVLAAVLFTAMFVFWTYYPHGLPLPTSLAGPKSPVTSVAPATSARPSNPVTDITPSPQRPSNPVTDITPSPRPSR
jgi:hypothetical protein